MQDSMCLEVFMEGSPEHVLEMVVLEDHIEEVVVLDVLDPVCLYTFICVEIKTNTKTVALGMFQKVQRTLVPQPLGMFQKVQRTLVPQARFFLFLSWKECLRVSTGPIFF